MQKANEAILQAKTDESNNLHSQVVSLTSATAQLTMLVQQMLDIQSGTRDGPSTPKRRAITQPTEPTAQLETGTSASKSGNYLMDEE
jgi:hypothetical protein